MDILRLKRNKIDGQFEIEAYGLMAFIFTGDLKLVSDWRSVWFWFTGNGEGTRNPFCLPHTPTPNVHTRFVFLMPRNPFCLHLGKLNG